MPKGLHAPRSGIYAHKLPARLADREIEHLEKVLNARVLSDAQIKARGLDPSYWVERATALTEKYVLSTSQRSRVAALASAFAKQSPVEDTEDSKL